MESVGAPRHVAAGMTSGREPPRPSRPARRSDTPCGNLRAPMQNLRGIGSAERPARNSQVEESG